MVALLLEFEFVYIYNSVAFFVSAFNDVAICPPSPLTDGCRSLPACPPARLPACLSPVAVLDHHAPQASKVRQDLLRLTPAQA